jgi:hypothetical protein
MSLVDRGKAVYRRLTDRLYPHRIVFHHVPKCGGTSVGRSLRRAYLFSQGTVTPEESFKAVMALAGRADVKQGEGNVFEFRETMLLYLLYSDIRCVSAHVPFSDVAHDKFHGAYRFVTLLRDPVNRFVSHYLWNHNRPSAHEYTSDEFEYFLNTDRAKILGSTFVRYFCGQPGSTLSDMSAATEAAIANLRRLDHVGFLDEMVSFQGALQQLTGKRLKIGRENVGKTRSAHKRILESNLRQKILEICAPDRKIWDAVQDLRNSRPGFVAMPASDASKSAAYARSAPKSAGPRTI